MSNPVKGLRGVVAGQTAVSSQLSAISCQLACVFPEAREKVTGNFPPLARGRAQIDDRRNLLEQHVSSAVD